MIKLIEAADAGIALREKASANEHWKFHPCGMSKETMRTANIIASHNCTPYLGVDNANFAAHAANNHAKMCRAVKIMWDDLIEQVCCCDRERRCKKCVIIAEVEQLFERESGA